MTFLERGRTGLILLGVLLFFSAADAKAEPVPFGEGTHALRAILHMKKLAPITSEDDLRNELKEHPHRVLLLSLGNQDWLQRFPGDLHSFIKGGGAFLGATDQPTGEPWNGPFHWTVNGEIDTTKPDSDLSYRGSKDCPFVVPVSAPRCPVFLGLQKVSTNLPSYLEEREGGGLLPIIARLPGHEQTTYGDIVLLKNGLPFAAGGPIGNGRALLVADHSIFINDMMLPTDNQNFDFASHSLDWLTDYGSRDRVYFMDDGVLVTNFNVPVKELPPVPPPSFSQMLGLFYRLATGLEREDFFRKRLNQFHEQVPDLDRRLGNAVPHTGLLRVLTALLTLGLFVIGLTMLIRSRYQPDAQAPLLAPALAKVQATDVVLDRRRAAVLQAGNFWEPAHALARQFFEAALPGYASEAVPEAACGDRHEQRTRQRQVRRLWQMARAVRPWRISAREFERTVAEIDVLKAALAADTLRLRHA